MAGGKSRKSGGISKALIRRIQRQSRIKDKAEESNARELVPMTLDTPEIPDDWDYYESVTQVRTFVYKWKNLTVKLANELWIARELLSAQGQRTDLTSGVSARSWSEYCEDIGTSRRRVNEWLVRWFGHTAHEPIEKAQPDKRKELIQQMNDIFAHGISAWCEYELIVLKENWDEWWTEISDKLDGKLKRPTWQELMDEDVPKSQRKKKKRGEKEKQRNRRKAAG